MADYRFKRGENVWVTGPDGRKPDVVKDRATVMGSNVYYLTDDRSRGALPEYALETRDVPLPIEQN